MDPVAATDVSAGGEDNAEDDHDAEQDEGAGPEGEVLQEPAGQRPGHGWWFPTFLHTATQGRCKKRRRLRCEGLSIIVAMNKK